MTADDDRLHRLREGKLRALVRARPGLPADADLRGHAFAGGSAVQAGDDLWVLVADDAERGFGRALLLATRHPFAALHVVHEDPAEAPRDARRAASLTLPTDVWTVEGTELRAAAPAPLPTPPDPPSGPEVAELVGLLTSADVEVVAESGVITGEIHGLEVARVRIGDDGRPVLDVGVGRFDQEATALLHADLPTRDAVVRAASMVRDLRRRDATPHPVNRLARERWLRTQVLERPALVGLEALVPISPPVPRRNVKEPWPAAAIGHRPSGVPVLVVCTVGVDLTWVPFTVDLLERERPGELLVVLPPRDLLPAQHRLAALLPVRSTFVPLDGDWPV
jgi:hypothetical protein